MSLSATVSCTQSSPPLQVTRQATLVSGDSRRKRRARVTVSLPAATWYAVCLLLHVLVTRTCALTPLPVTAAVWVTREASAVGKGPTKQWGGPCCQRQCCQPNPACPGQPHQGGPRTTPAHPPGWWGNVFEGTDRSAGVGLRASQDGGASSSAQGGRAASAPRDGRQALPGRVTKQGACSCPAACDNSTAAKPS